ncbi:MAG: PHP domain-containing protein [Clostridiales bacterium]|uniref:Polymerase/histidinol phosphatase N-terminal domain-containing protein n=1 Tax=Harryflintia acetispora TaxID=1849041 RepID=A0A9X8Y8F8_9FIRM|nr:MULTISPECIES: PHP domain-containing protein [Oscillospiraceae]PWM37989.1 MAG: PHP domain-containing protein [Clostridiales bacterium]TCL43828.1 hypothetical protein EDD78_104167 [Harryflintia acetispora]
MTADLHCHSRVSDGSMGIDDIVFYAKRAGLSFLALTDHDTMAGVTRAGVIGKRYGVQVIPGVEISCKDPATGKKVHLLCYLPDKPDRLEGFLKSLLDKRAAAGMQMIKNVMQYYPLTVEHVAKYYSSSQSIYRAHIMHALIDLGYDNQIYGEVYRALFGKGGSCFVPVDYPDIEKGLQIVREAQGVAVIAHPGETGSLELCERLAAEGRIQGLEVYHPHNDEETRGRLLTLCQRFSLVPTGGTDFHGFYRPHPYPLGSFLAPPDAVSQLYQLKAKNA